MPDTSDATIVPLLRFQDAQRMIDWLRDAFGFEPTLVVPGEDGAVTHVELMLGRSMVMGGSFARATEYGRHAHPPGTAMAYVIISDVDGHCEQARKAGAEILIEPHDLSYGGRDYTARDPEGNLWTFGSYRPEQLAS